jgi:hypothetical protein
MSYDQAYKDTVVESFKQKGFCECAFKGTGHWYEILDVSQWNWDKFDYRIADYDNSKSTNELIGNTETFVNGFFK